MTLCLACGEATDKPYHGRCLVELFGTPEVPAVDAELARLHTLALAMVGRVSVSGVQRKLSVRLTADRATLQIALGDGHYSLKPQASTFPNLPENEWVTQRLAALAGLTVPQCALLKLHDGTWAYVVRRFDRRDDGSKRAMEDFCQLSGLPPSGKYDGSAERCGKLVGRHTSEPLIDLRLLYRQFAFSWWVGNGDLHLKNLALIRDDDGRIRLSPAYDLLNTRLVLPDDVLAMPVSGKKDNLQIGAWRKLADSFGLGAKAAQRVHDELVATLPAALQLVARSPLPEAMREAYCALLQERALR